VGALGIPLPNTLGPARRAGAFAALGQFNFFLLLAVSLEAPFVAGDNASYWIGRPAGAARRCAGWRGACLKKDTVGAISGLFWRALGGWPFSPAAFSFLVLGGCDQSARGGAELYPYRRFFLWPSDLAGEALGAPDPARAGLHLRGPVGIPLGRSPWLLLLFHPGPGGRSASGLSDLAALETRPALSQLAPSGPCADPPPPSRQTPRQSYDASLEVNVMLARPHSSRDHRHPSAAMCHFDHVRKRLLKTKGDKRLPFYRTIGDAKLYFRQSDERASQQGILGKSGGVFPRATLLGTRRKGPFSVIIMSGEGIISGLFPALILSVESLGSGSLTFHPPRFAQPCYRCRTAFHWRVQLPDRWMTFLKMANPKKQRKTVLMETRRPETWPYVDDKSVAKLAISCC